MPGNHYLSLIHIYLFLTKTTKERISQQSNFTTLCRGFIIPKEIRDPEAISRFLDAVGQAESIIRESGLIGIRRLTTEEILGDEKTPGILNQYFTLNFEHSVNEDIKLDPGRMMIGDKILCMHCLLYTSGGH